MASLIRLTSRSSGRPEARENPSVKNGMRRPVEAVIPSARNCAIWALGADPSPTAMVHPAPCIGANGARPSGASI